jgi:hypothetical protein
MRKTESGNGPHLTKSVKYVSESFITVGLDVRVQPGPSAKTEKLLSNATAG